MQINISNLKKTTPFVEIVERKGLGHPDTITDSIVEKISIEIANYYLKKFGEIFHFNVDKAFLSAGEAKTKFGGGKIIKPMLLVLGDRATYVVNGEKLPIDEIVEKSVNSWLKENLRFVDETNVKIQNEIKQGSEELTSIFNSKDKFFPANDTSALVGYSPMTPLERSVYELERYLNSKKFKKEYPETGEDIKIMGLRIGDKYRYTLAVAFVDRFIKNESHYFELKDKIKEEALEFLKNSFSEIQIPEVLINTLDVKGKGEDGCYLTVTGTSAEAGDSGEVGRGNRANGIIALNRPAGSEAAAGKNMVSHVGKIYNLLAFTLSKDIFEGLGKENYVWLLSQIGKPVNDPIVVSVQVEDFDEKEKSTIEEIIQKRFEHLDDFIKDLIKGNYEVC